MCATNYCVHTPHTQTAPYIYHTDRVGVYTASTWSASLFQPTHQTENMIDPVQSLVMFISFPSFIEIRTPEGGLSKIGTIIAKIFSFNYARVATECDTISQIVPLRFSQALWFFITHSQSQSRSKYPKIRMPATPKYYVWFSYRIYLKRSVHSHSMGWPRLVGSFQS